MKTVYFVACVSEKAAVALPAEELYRSDWFRTARDYVCRHRLPGDCWYVLSAQHHLVDPRQVLAPYDKTLLRMRKPERQVWAGTIFTQLGSILNPGDEVVPLAGRRYHELLQPRLTQAGYRVDVPMRSLAIAKQMRWLRAAIGEGHHESASGPCSVL